jgi:tetratricopeptide (TPR) repeat protein
MNEHSAEFDPTTFEPHEAPEEVCWEVLPQLSGSIQAMTLFHLGLLAFDREDLLRASTLAEAAADVFRETGIHSMAARALLSAGRSFNALNDLPEAVKRVQQAHTDFLESNNSHQAVKASSFLASLLVKSGRFEEAVTVVKESLALIEREGGSVHDPMMEELHSFLGHALFGLGKYREACRTFEKASEWAIRLDRASVAPLILHRAGLCEFQLGAYHKAVNYFLANYNVGVVEGDTEFIAASGTNLVMTYRVLGEFEVADRYIELLTVPMQECTDLILKAFYYREVAEMHLRHSHYQAAFEAAEKSFSAFNFDDQIPGQIQAGTAVVTAATRLGRFSEANAYLNRIERLISAASDNVIEDAERESFRLLRLWVWVVEIEYQSGWVGEYGQSLLADKMEESYNFTRLVEFLEVKFEDLAYAPSLVAHMLVLRSELMYSECETSGPSAEVTQVCISHILEVFEKCSDHITQSQHARLHHLLAKARGFRFEAYRSYAKALTLYLELDDKVKVQEIASEMQHLFDLRTEAEIEKSWNRPKSQKAKALKTSLGG